MYKKHALKLLTHHCKIVSNNLKLKRFLPLPEACIFLRTPSVLLCFSSLVYMFLFMEVGWVIFLSFCCFHLSSLPLSYCSNCHSLFDLAHFLYSSLVSASKSPCFSWLLLMLINNFMEKTMTPPYQMQGWFCIVAIWCSFLPQVSIIVLPHYQNPQL